MNGFSCEPLGCRLTVSSCARRAKASREAGNMRTGRALVSGHCRDCAVGREHELGREPSHWPDGRPVVRLQLVPDSTPEAARPVATEVPQVPGLLVSPAEAEEKRAARAPKPKRQRPRSDGTKRSSGTRGRLYEWQGRMVGLFELARTPEAIAAGVDWKAISRRLTGPNAWPIEQALTTPAWKSEGTVHRGKTYSWRGRDMTLMELWHTPECQAIGISSHALRQRLFTMGWDPERAITSPVCRHPAPKQLALFAEQKNQPHAAATAGAVTGT